MYSHHNLFDYCLNYLELNKKDIIKLLREYEYKEMFPNEKTHFEFVQDGVKLHIALMIVFWMSDPLYT